MIGINLLAYIAVMPIIAFTAQRGSSFMAGVGFAFFYGFVGMMASGHGLRDIYPITAGLTLIGYQDGRSETGNIFISLMVILVMLLVAVLLVATSKNREITSTTKGKGKKKTAYKRNQKRKAR